jgi:hypothetical protein
MSSTGGLVRLPPEAHREQHERAVGAMMFAGCGAAARPLAGPPGST